MKNLEAEKDSKKKARGLRMKFLRERLGARRGLKDDGEPRTSLRAFAIELGFTETPHAWGTYRSWEAGSFPNDIAEMSDRIARLARVKAMRLDPTALAVWVEHGIGDAPLGASAAPSDDPPPPRTDRFGVGGDAFGDADVIQFEDLVEQLGRAAQDRILDAATTGEKIPEKFQQLVRVALDVRDGLRKNQRPEDHRGIPERKRAAAA